ncbi:MAG TPA: uracil-DNA glycosylase [Terriglobales bacterium]|nr:uracil-DNA glycosylase [Terriglobales bacterium]
MSSDATPRRQGAQVEPLRKLDQIQGYVEYQRQSGVEGFAYAAGGKRRGQTAAAAPAARAAAAVAGDLAPAPSSPGELAALADLEQLRAVIGDCRRCKLCSGRTNLVFGVGNVNADLMFVGEGPGRDEDLKGEPFVGRAGQLLTEIITKGMKLSRDDVYIANVVKCRPPENRNPEPDEIAACRPFLEKQIELVKPRVLVALGKFAAQTMLNDPTPISRLRGHWHDYRGIKLMPTLHPAYLLRNPADKRLVWDDIKLVMQELGLPV